MGVQQVKRVLEMNMHVVHRTPLGDSYISYALMKFWNVCEIVMSTSPV